jgi:2-oxoglutarate ferredoxin oxidoreductase subunit beta
MLGMMRGDMPVALGVIRDVPAPTYDMSVDEQVADVQAKSKIHNLRELLMQGDVWEVKPV